MTKNVTEVVTNLIMWPEALSPHERHSICVEKKVTTGRHKKNEVKNERKRQNSRTVQFGLKIDIIGSPQCLGDRKEIQRSSTSI